MHRHSLESATLASAGYSAAQATLELEFQTGAIYHFFGVPESCFQQLLAAESKGQFFNRFVRNRFPFQQVTTGIRTASAQK